MTTPVLDHTLDKATTVAALGYGDAPAILLFIRFGNCQTGIAALVIGGQGCHVKAGFLKPTTPAKGAAE